MAARSYKITFGGWYQRTTLHLTEIYDFLAHGTSRLDLSKEKLESHKKSLQLTQVTREVGYLEYVRAQTRKGIGIKYYEDGLYILEFVASDIASAQKLLSDYFEELFEPAISYIFSLGAPTPKILANIKSFHPTAVSLVSKKHSEFKINEKRYGKVYNQIDSKGTTVYKTPSHIFIVSDPKLKNSAELVEMQVFFREFKDQLEKYLNIHRVVWEEIAEIKERGSIKGKEVVRTRSMLESYKKTIDLISNRINQMASYISTRQAISEKIKVEKAMIELFQYKFETLSDTHAYIKEIWKMTSDYVEAAIKIIVEVETQSADSSIKSLRLVTTIGVVSGVLGYLARDTLPRVTTSGAIFFALLLLGTWMINSLIVKAYRSLPLNLRPLLHLDQPIPAPRHPSIFQFLLPKLDPRLTCLNYSRYY